MLCKPRRILRLLHTQLRQLTTNNQRATSFNWRLQYANEKYEQNKNFTFKYF